MRLSAGALGVSIAFIRNVAAQPVQDKTWLASSWGLFAGSLVAVLLSLLTSQWDLRRATKEFDERNIRPDSPGFVFYFTLVLNITSAVAFLAGVGCLVVFALANLE